jgi:ferredoxin-NADP reductase
VISIVLEPIDPKPAPPGVPGQFLTVRLRPDPEAPPVTRNYSISGPPTGGGYRISVKREPCGVASRFLHSRLAPGDALEVAAPRGTFTLQDGERPVVLISAGVGATPLMAMLHSLAAARSDREIWWIHGARNRAQHSFRAESARLLAALPHPRRVIAYSSRAHAIAPGTTSTSTVGSAAPSWNRPECQPTPTSTSAGRRRSWTSWVPRWPPAEWPQTA